MLYKSLFRGSVEYGAFMYPLQHYTCFARLEKIQTQLIKRILGLRRSTPNNVALAEACEPPLGMRFQYLALRFVIRTQAASDHVLIDKLSALHGIISGKRTSETIRNFPLYKAYVRAREFRNITHASAQPPGFTLDFPSLTHVPSISVTPKYIYDNRPLHLIPSLILAYHEEVLSLPTTIYTDASKTEDGTHVGYAIYSPELHLRQQRKISMHSSIYTAEALAIKLAIQVIVKRRITNGVILTDSLSVFTALQSTPYRFPTNPIIAELRKDIYDAKQQYLDIQFIWIPAHLGIPGNEEADRLAKQAISTGTLQPQLLPYSDLYAIPSADLNNALIRYRNFKFRRKGVLYGKHYLQSTSQPWFTQLNASRELVTLLCRLRSNHCNTAWSLFRINLADSPSCSCGSIVQDLDHIFWHCPLHSLQRRTFIAALPTDLKTALPLRICDLLKRPSLPLIKAIHKMLHNSGLKL